MDIITMQKKRAGGQKRKWRGCTGKENEGRGVLKHRKDVNQS